MKRYTYSITGLKYFRKRVHNHKLSRNAVIYIKYRESRRLQDDCILYSSFYGQGMVCNPYAIFREICARDTTHKYKHIWVINDEEEIKRLNQTDFNGARCEFVKHKSRKHLLYLATARYIVDNISFPDFMAKREGQICLFTWHSVTIKTLGFDEPNATLPVRNMLRTCLQTDYILSANPFMTNIFLDSYKLRGLYEGKILESGQPRVDTMLGTDRNKMIKRLQAIGINIDPSKKTVLYAPTFRGNFSRPKFVRENWMGVVAGLQSDYQVLCRPHYTEYNVIPMEERKKINAIPPCIDACELLSVADILVTDYSSIFIDFLPTGRPVYFYMPDYESYKDDRGCYYKPEELPGPISKTPEELALQLASGASMQAAHREKYLSFQREMCPNDDGNAAKRVVDVVFGQQHLPCCIDAPKTEKVKLLFYVSNLAYNGVTTAFLALTNHIDYSKYDVTAVGLATTQDSKILWNQINPNVRRLVQIGTAHKTNWEKIGYRYVVSNGFAKKFSNLLYPNRFFAREAMRRYGNAHFDFIIDFNGYGLSFTLVSLALPGAKRIIWQHNDLKEDLENTKKKRLSEYSRAPTVTVAGLNSIYNLYDKIVGATKEVMEINLEKLSNGRFANKYTFAHNMMDIEAMSQKIEESLTDEVPKELEQSGASAKFVTIGRLSPEKNHANLIHGFKLYCDEYPESKLFIVGAGGLQKALTALIEELQLTNKVFLLGRLSNPFTVLRHCDCFILPSFYEAQGLVVIEARALKMPIILSKFGAYMSVYLEGGQKLIGHEPKDILEGLRAWHDGKISTDYEFDLEEYNRKAYREFEALIQN